MASRERLDFAIGSQHSAGRPQSWAEFIPLELEHCQEEMSPFIRPGGGHESWLGFNAKMME
jgi:hypothetical protein